jgi:4-hydroxy-tetrahydrodipicolinate synthase
MSDPVETVPPERRLKLPLRGVIPPIATPLRESGDLDAAALKRLVERVVTGGVHGLFLLGTTGEFCSLSAETLRAVIDEGCAAAAERVPVIVNVSGTALEESVKLARHAARAGAAAVAICPPFYYPITQDDLARYTNKFSQRVDLPVFLYNIPQNATFEFEVETVYRLAETPNVIGLKNSNGNLDYLAAVYRVKAHHPTFSLLVGNEEIMMSAIDRGADGGVCGGANLFPRLYVRLYQALVEGRRSEAHQLQESIVKVAEAIYTVGPAGASYLRGLKGALAELGVCGASLAEPLEAFDQDEQRELRARLTALNVNEFCKEDACGGLF